MRRKWLILWGIVVLGLSGCGGAKPAAQAVIGRWQITADSTIYEPYAFAHDIEVRENGQWIILLVDGDRAYTVDVNRYSFPADGKIQITGWCYQGYARSECTGEFNFSVDDKTLNIFDDAGHRAVYKRVGDIGSIAPPTLVPPFATLTPTP
jgi:hypothetical protein